jgi:hypothetical protein
MTDSTDIEVGLDGLPPDARARLDVFAGALEHVHVDDLVLYSARLRQPRHRRAVERAAFDARQAGLDAAIEAARSTLGEGVAREYASAMVRVSFIGLNSAPGLGPTDDRVQVMRSIGDAVTAIVLWERLDADDRSELLGLWARLLPQA